jgi:drug/metabolite transporter (DMT)-like permease
LTLLAGIAGISFAAIFVRLAAPAPPVIIAFYRTLFASLLMAAWFWIRRRPIALEAPSRNFALLAGLCFGTDMALWNTSIVHTSVATATLLVNTTPVYVSLYALLVLRERLDRRFAVGTALALAGAAVLVGLPASARESTAGALLALSAAVFYAGYLLLMKAARRGADAVSTVFLATVSSTVILGAYGVAGGDAFSGFPAHSWALMGAAAVVSQIAGVMGIIWALRFVPATVASVLLLAQPVGTAALGWLLLGEAVSPIQAFGGCAVLAGISLVSRSAAVPPAVATAPETPRPTR